MDKKQIDHEIKYIVDQIVSKYAPNKIILFGSAARGEYDNLNDLDFMVIKHDVPAIGINRLRELDSLIDRNMAVDLLVYRPDEIEERKNLCDPFILSIIAEGRVLYG
ncbi:MAG: nucleotidyltransferase domain-containing protein [Desulfobacterales bacterium]|jgi:predicted nucleotidyltransferase|nr:nucleotidyltransferase domain-containing protein [Desulfobacterales bacterium]